MLVGKMMRETLISCLPKGGRVIEIGVAEGVFSASILQTAQPARLHLVDPWIHQDNPEYVADKNNVDDATNEDRHRGVLEKFAPEIECGAVQVHRGFSKEVLPEFPDGYFDWAYVDAMHTRDAVLEDLRLVWPKVKEDGFILGHDYSNGPHARALGFGVVEGVRDFLDESKGVIVAVTMLLENYPSYALAKSMHSGIRPFAEQFLLKAEAVVEIRSRNPDYQHKVAKIGDTVVAFPSF